MSLQRVNLDNLHKQKIDREKKKINSYEEVLRRCHHRIETTAKTQNYCFCFFTIPSYIFGVPKFDTSGCILYLVDSLVNNGFDVKYTHPNLLYISWLNKYNKPEKERKQIKNKQYKTIEEYKPSGKFIYDKTTVDLLSNKAYKLLE